MPTLNHTLAWQGFSLTVPTDWNLAHFQGNHAAGLITLADLRAPTLTLRWQSPGNPARAHAKLLHSLQKKHAQITPTTHHSSLTSHHSISHPTFTGQILLSPTRLYELESTHASLTTLHFQDHSQSPTWPWSLFGIQGLIPKAFHLQKASLHPGRPQLTFRRLRTTILLGAWPLADQLLQSRPLAQWARSTIPLLRNSSAQLHHSTPTTATFQIPRKLRRPLQFTLTHNPATNTIHWTQFPITKLLSSSCPFTPSQLRDSSSSSSSLSEPA